jgi:hypothetical protein
MTSMPPAAPAAPAPEKGCLGRNLACVIIGGCLGLLALFVALGVGIFFVVMSAMQSSDAYTQSLARAQEDPAVVEALGTPIEAGYFISGNINVSGYTGNADMTIPISGPNGAGTIHVVGTKSGDTWTYSVMEVQITGTGETIDLLED